MQYYMEIIGLTLAVIDFTGYTHRLEVVLDRIRKSLQSLVKSERYRRIRKTTFLVVLLLSIILFLILYSQGAFNLGSDLGCGDTDFGCVLISFFIKIIVYVLSIIIAAAPVLIYLMVIGVLWLLANVFSLLAKPRAGIVGTLGLLLAIGSFVFGRPY